MGPRGRREGENRDPQSQPEEERWEGAGGSLLGRKGADTLGLPCISLPTLSLGPVGTSDATPWAEGQ